MGNPRLPRKAKKRIKKMFAKIDGLKVKDYRTYGDFIFKKIYPMKLREIRKIYG